VTRGQLPQRAGLPGLNGGGAAAAVPPRVSVVTVDFQATFKDVLVRSVVLNAPTSVLLLVFPYLPNTSFFRFFSMLRVLVVFGLNATLIFSLIIIIIIIIIIVVFFFKGKNPTEQTQTVSTNNKH